MRTAKTLIRLGGCPGWSESLPGAHATLLVLSRGGSDRDVLAYLYKNCGKGLLVPLPAGAAFGCVIPSIFA